jgi:hypothetical protein
MGQVNVEKEILSQSLEIMDKAGLSAVSVLFADDLSGNENAMDTLLMSIKSLNARYDKADAIAQIRFLMDRYNIQIDQLMEGRIS